MSGQHVPYGAPPSDYVGPRRSLVLAGGGLRLSYQAGAIRALVEHGLCFAHMDGTSGGSINLAQLLSGLSPDELCARWRDLKTWDTLALMPIHRMVRGAASLAMGGTSGMRKKVFPHLGIDFDAMNRAEGVDATFNILDYGEKTVRVVPHTNVDEDILIAGMSLPGVFEPVDIDGSLYLDTAFVQDANLMEAVDRGADEIWLIWGLGNTPTYRGGPLRLYVQMLEMSANGALNVEFERIKEINKTRTTPIRVHVIRPSHPLPLDPALYTGTVDHATLIDQGYADAVAYLDSRHGTLTPETLMMSETGPDVTFREQLTGELHGIDQTTTPVVIDAAVTVSDSETRASSRVSIGRVGDQVSARSTEHRPHGYSINFGAPSEVTHLVAERTHGTTFDVTVHKGDDPSGPVIATGSVQLDSVAAVKKALSLRVSGLGGTGAKARAYAGGVAQLINGRNPKESD